MSIAGMFSQSRAIDALQVRVAELERVQMLMIEQASVAAGAALRHGELVAEILRLVKKNG